MLWNSDVVCLDAVFFLVFEQKTCFTASGIPDDPQHKIVRRNAQKMDYYRMAQTLEQLAMAKEETAENLRRIVETVYVNGDELKVELKADQWLNKPTK